MSASSFKHTVLVLGATGITGSSIVDGLFEAKKYRIIAGVRPSSLTKPEVSTLKERGVEIRSFDLSGTPEELDAALKGVDTVIFAMTFTEVEKQTLVADASKRVGVKRFIPDDWATPCERGVRKMYDQKTAIQDYIKTIALGYTFIDVGLWTTFALPSDTEESRDTFLPSFSHRITGSGDVKIATTHVPDIGRYVAEIIDDHRTLNQYVFCWNEEKTQKEHWEIARKAKLEVTAGDESLKATPKYESEAEVRKKVRDAAEGTMAQIGSEYTLSLCIRGDSSVENAKKPEFGGALDARELYPHLKVTSIEEVAKSLYKSSA